MKLVYTDGCTVSGLCIDGEAVNPDMSLEEAKELYKKVSEKFCETAECSAELIGEIQDMLMQRGAYKYLYHCEQCGDSVVEYSMEI